MSTGRKCSGSKPGTKLMGGSTPPAPPPHPLSCRRQCRHSHSHSCLPSFLSLLAPSESDTMSEHLYVRERLCPTTGGLRTATPAAKPLGTCLSPKQHALWLSHLTHRPRDPQGPRTHRGSDPNVLAPGATPRSQQLAKPCLPCPSLADTS